MDDNEESLFSGWSILLFVLIISAILIALFPGKKLLESFNKKPIDQTSIEYLKVSIDQSPEDKQLRLRLANAQVSIGQLDDAIKTLETLLDSEHLATQAQFLIIKIQFRQYFEATQASAKKNIKTELLKKISLFHPTINNIAQLDLLAQWSQQLATPLLATEIYAHIIQILEHKENNQVRSDFWQLIGIHSAYAEESNKDLEYYVQKHLQALLAANQLEQALKKAQHYVPKFQHSKAILDLAIKIAGYANKPLLSRDWGRLSLTQFGWSKPTLQQQINRELAANQPQNSLIWSKSVLKNHANSMILLSYTAELASNLGDKQLAKTLRLQLLAKSPDDPVLIAQLIQSELSLSNLPSALKYAQQLVSLNPNSIAAHKQLADIALWAGNSALSVKQKIWLYQQTQDESFSADAIRIGKALFQFDKVSELYANISHVRPLSDVELTDYYQVLQATGFQDAGAKALKDYINSYPQQQQARLYLAKTQSLTGHFKQATKTLSTTEDKFGKSTTLSLLQVQTLLNVGDFNSAWQHLSQAAKTSPSMTIEFWQLYSKMARFLGHESAEQHSYYQLLSSDNIDQPLMSRLIQLSSKNQDKQQLELLLIGWDKFKQPSYLLDAIDLTLKLKQTQQTIKLVTIADHKNKLFKNSIRYWAVKASIASKEKKRIQAKHYLLQALALDPQSVDTRISLLWHMIDHGSDIELRTLLDNSHYLAAHNADLWEVFAAAYRRLGEPIHAIPWYVRSVQQKPNDYLLLLNYAEALVEAGKSAKAKTIRRYIVTKIRPELVANLAETKTEIAEFKRRYGVVLQDEFGIDISEKWFSYAQTKNNHLKQAIFDEYRITWLLAKGRMIPARRYVLKELQQRVDLAAWQQMAIAVYDNDLEAIESTLKSPAKLLPTDRVVGLRAIGKEQSALISARNYLESSQWENERLILRRQAADLGVRKPNGFAISTNSKNISELDQWAIKSTAAFTRGIDSFWLEYQHIDLSSSLADLLVQPNQQQENNMRLKWRHRGIRNESWIQGHVDLRDDQNLFGISAGNIHQLWDGWSVDIEGAYNEKSDESAAFRLMGARDRISLGLNGQITKRDYFGINLHGRHFKTRTGDALGVGYGIEFNTGYRVKYAQPEITINLHGNLSKANLKTSLPKQLQKIIGANRGIESVLAKSYQETGINFRIQDGDFRPFGFVERNLHYYLDTGVFISDSSSGIGSSVEGGMGMRLFAHDDLSLNGRYSSVQGGVNSIATKSIELRYSVRFD